MDPRPLWLLAELTYKCPLQCPYCSNPLDFAGPRFKRELSTDEWCRVFREAKALGVLQLGLSGGEPTLRADLEVLVDEAHGLGLYTSLITSAYRLTKERLTGLKAAGLDHVQISIQGADAELSDTVAGTGLPAHRQRRAAPPQPASGGGADPARRVARRGTHRARQHAVLRVGAPQPHCTHADQGAARRSLARGAARARPTRDTTRDRVGVARLS